MKSSSQYIASESIDCLHPLLVNAGLAMHNGDWNWKDVNSPFMRIYYVESGEASIHMPEGLWQLKPGHLYMIPAFVMHSYSCDKPFCHYYLHIYLDQDPKAAFSENYEFPVEVAASDFDAALVKRLCVLNPSMTLPGSNPNSYDNRETLQQNIIRNKERAMSLRIESRGIIYLLLSRFMAEAKPRIVSTDPRIQDIVAFIRHHISQPITIDTLAEVACLSKDHVTRLFKKEMGETPTQYIIRKKIDRAQQLLLTDTSAIKAIAYTLGFEDHSYFIRLFRKQIGMSPQAYRRNYLNKFLPGHGGRRTNS